MKSHLAGKIIVFIQILLSAALLFEYSGAFSITSPAIGNLYSE